MSGPLGKVCRLCADTEGPFLNIFGVGMDLSGKIRNLLPFVIDEWDDLPHKVCFRCSAKIAEFHEFVNKCIKTQEHFFSKLGKNSSKKDDKLKKARAAWEETLLKKKISNDEYCDELIQKALDSLPSLAGEIKSFDTDTGKLKPKDLSLKDVKVVLTRIDKNKKGDENKDYSIRTRNRKKDSESLKATDNIDKDTNSPIGELSNNITYLDVSDVSSIYTCKICSRIFTQQEKIKNHSCIASAKPSVEANNNDDSQIENKKKSVNFHPVVEEVISPSDKKDKLKKKVTKSQAISNTSINVTENNLAIPAASNSLSNNLPVRLPATSVCPVTQQPGCFLVQLPDNSYVLVKNQETPVPVNEPPNPNYFIPNTTVTNTNVTINAPRLYGITDSDGPYKKIIHSKYLSNSAKDRKQTKASEPYPVGLFCRGNQEINLLDESSSSMPMNTNDDGDKSDDESMEESLKNKEYKIMPQNKPGKIIITSINKSTTKQDPVQISKKRGHKGHKVKKNQKRDSSPNSLAKSATVENFSAEDEEPIFTFFNIDPNSDPSYVLPTTNTVQESLISTTAQRSGANEKVKRKSRVLANQKIETKVNKDVYRCYICDLQFEKQSKLVAHIDIHFEKHYESDSKIVKGRKRRKI